MRDMMAQIRDAGDGIRDGTYTMTAPKITGGTITGATVTSNTFSSSGATITGGTINSTAIGGTTAAAGKFTTLEATGVTTVQAGTVSLPAITTSGDTNTGIFFPAADTIAFTEGGVESMRIDSSGNVGIGTSSPSEKLEINNGNLAVGNAGSNFSMKVSRTGANASSVVVGAFTNEPDIQWTYTGSGALRFTDSTASAERMRIDSSGNLLVGTTTAQAPITAVSASSSAVLSLDRTSNIDANLRDMVQFRRSVTSVGTISCSNTATAYNTSSDYRLKENIAPMTGALAKVSALKPVTYNWKLDGSVSEGFIAHELQAIVPDCVSGEKDAVDEDGNPKYQGIDTSFLVATLTAAIQELNAKVEAQAVRIAELEGAR
jgi:hypothetical protein